MSESAAPACMLLAREMTRLRREMRFDVPDWAAAAAGRLAANAWAEALPPMVAIVGGASSGKSTVFNNLLAGHQPSSVTAKGHATLGPILAVHERHRAAVAPLRSDEALWPGYRAAEIELEAATPGDPHTVCLVVHGVDAAADVLLFDMPDFTSDAARREGDITMSLLPWFDALVVVVDHERWFDRQSISQLRTESVRFGQRRMALFNRTAEGELQPQDRAALAEQAQQLTAESMLILEFRRGRGFCRFPPGTLDEVGRFLRGRRGDRAKALRHALREAAGDVLNQNAERTARLAALDDSLRAAVERRLPTGAQCMTALMTADERRNLDAAARVLRLHQSSQWLTEQSRRWQRFFRQVPVFGALVPEEESIPVVAEHRDRIQVARIYQETLVRRLAAELRQGERSSLFWEEIRRWTGMEPPLRDEVAVDSTAMEVATRVFDGAMKQWVEKVEKECAGLSPHIKGALGIGTIGLALILIAAPGPLAALTIVAAKSAVAGALGHILMAGGAGALLGKHLSRLTAVVQEKLIGSPELTAVRNAAEGVREELATTAAGLITPMLKDASAYTLGSNGPLLSALEKVGRG